MATKCAMGSLRAEKVSEKVYFLAALLLSFTLTSKAVTVEKQDGFLEYIELGESKVVVLPIGDDGHFGPIAIPNVPFGDTTHTTLYVSANGLVTMGSLPGQTFSNRDFPLSGGSYYALAPFWVDLDPSVTGSISYEIHDCLDRSRDSISLLERVSNFVSEREEVNFQGTWMIVVLWEDIPEYTESGSSSTRNTFQLTVITNDVTTFAIFTYLCGDLDTTRTATVGFDASGVHYDNFEFSNNDNLACSNEDLSDFSNIVYKLSPLGGPAIAYLSTTGGNTFAMGDVSSPPLSVPSIPFGATLQDTAYVTIYGLLSFSDEPYISDEPVPFPTGTTSNQHIVAALWANYETYNNIFYAVHELDSGNPSSVELLEQVSLFVNSETDIVDFHGSWMVLGSWVNVAPLSDSESSFQGIVISDGLSTFAVIVYGCEHVTQLSGIVGFNAAEEFFENHEYTSVYLLTCHDADPNGFTNIVFTLGLTVSLQTEYTAIAENVTEISIVVCVSTSVREKFNYILVSNDLTTTSDDYSPVTLEALFDLCTCDSCNCLTLDLIIEDDNLFEPEREEFEISLSTDYFHFYVNPIVMTIIDNEIAVVQFTSEVYSGLEEERSVSVCVVLSGTEVQVGNFLEIGYHTGGGTATAGTDYVPSRGTVQLSVSGQPVCFSILLIIDHVQEFFENFEVSLSSDDRRVQLPSPATVTITENPVVTVSMVQEVYLVNEADMEVNVCVEIEGDVALNGLAVFVHLTTQPGTATEDVDYGPVGQRYLSFFPSTRPTTQCMTIPINDDFTVEQDETFNVNLHTSSDFTRVGLPVSTVTIINDDELLVSLERAEYEVLEGDAGNLRVCVVVQSGALDGSVGASVRVSVPTTEGNTATVQSDYIATTEILPLGPVTEAGAFRCVSIATVVNDRLTEPDEVFYVVLDADPPTILGSPDEASVTILDDDSIVVSLTETSYISYEGTSHLSNESSGVATVCAVIEEGQLDGETVQVEIRAEQGTAEANSDYVPGPKLVVFGSTAGAGDRGCVDFALIDDDETEDEEIFYVFLIAGSAPVTLGSNTSATVTIIDNDPTLLTLSEMNYVTSETQGYVEVCVVLVYRQQFETIVTVHLSLTPGTALDHDDYLPLSPESGVVQFGPDAEPLDTQCVNITIVKDGVAEDYEELTVSIDVTPDFFDVLIDTATITIYDHDLVTVSVLESANGYSVPEDTGEVEVCFHILTGELGTDVLVNLGTSQSSASAEADYEPTSVQLTFEGTSLLGSAMSGSGLSPLGTIQCVYITINDDDITEPEEIFYVTLAPERDFVQFESDGVIVTILDNDEVLIEVKNYTFNEDDGEVSVCAELVEGELEGVTVAVNLTTQPDSAHELSDYVPVLSHTLLFGPVANTGDTQCVTITLVDNGELESEERFTVVLETASDSAALSSSTASVTILDNDDNHVTDVVSADPLFTVAIRTQPDSPLGPTVSLCYQIHGDRNTSYNLLTTEYTSVNGLWSGITDSLNLLTRIGVQAISTTGQCHRILVDLNQCAVTIDGVSHTTDGVHYNSSGVVVTRDNDRVVLIRVPDGERADDNIELEVECESRRMVLESREVDVPMLQLRITRSQNDLPGSAHGFIGQFYHRIIGVTGPLTTDYYTVTVPARGDEEEREFKGRLYHLDWIHRKNQCLYVGNSQAGREDGDTDSVIAGLYSYYSVNRTFSEDGYRYGLFRSEVCE